MKVIKKTEITNWSHKHICGNCDSELEVESTDIKYTLHDGDQRDPSYETWSATCPVCSNSFNIAPDKIPKLIRVEAKNRFKPAYSGSGRDYWDR